MKKQYIKWLGMLLLCLLLMSTASAWAQGEETVLVVNNQLYAPENDIAVPQIVEGRMYVPLRLISTALGHQVEWFSDSNQIAIATKNSGRQPAAVKSSSEDLSININGAILATNNETGRPFMLEGGYTMVPLRVIGEALSCDVIWENGLVIVSETNVVKTEEISPPSATVITASRQPQENVENTISNRYELSIFGSPIATKEQIQAFLNEREQFIRTNLILSKSEKSFIPYPDHIIDLYLEIGAKYNIRGDLALAQALKETGYFQFGGSVEPFQNNYCGLGATGTPLLGNEPLNGVNSSKAFYLSGLHGLSFATPAFGVEAHLQHLYAYASTEDLPVGTELLDPRFNYVQRGVSPRWVDLNGHWAIPGDGYGESIIDDFWLKMLQY